MRERGTAAPTRPTATSGRHLRSGSAKVSWVESAGIALFCVAIAFPRIGAGSFRGVVWAEDGAVFLEDAYNAGLLTSLFDPYEGYVLLVPRLITAFVVQFPLMWHGLMMCLAGAVVQTMVALFAFHVIYAQSQRRLAAWIVALGVAAVPVGAEVVDNVANIQWFLLFAGCLAPTWRPNGLLGRLASLIAMTAATTSSPFGGLAVGIAAVMWAKTRARANLMLVLVGMAGFGLQLMAMLTAPPRSQELGLRLDPPELAAGYLRRVLGDGILGTGVHPLDEPAPSIARGLVALVILACLMLLLARTTGVRSLALPAAMMGLSVITYLIPVALSGRDTLFPQHAGRYYVAPVLFLLAACGLLIERELTARTRLLALSAQSILGTALACAVLFGLVASWQTPGAWRGDQRSWAAEVAEGASACDRRPHMRHTRLDVAPDGWEVKVPCSLLSRAN